MCGFSIEIARERSEGYVTPWSVQRYTRCEGISAAWTTYPGGGVSSFSSCSGALSWRFSGGPLNFTGQRTCEREGSME